MNFKIYFEQTWELTKENLVMLIVMTLVMAVLTMITLGILGPVIFAGYTYAILLLVREGREPCIQDLFSQMRLFLPLIFFSLLSVILVLIGFLLFFIPGIVVGVAISFLCMYMVPCMVDQEYGIADAIKQSVSIIKQNFTEHAITAVIYIGLGWIGSLVAIGWLFTLPFATIFILLIYEDNIKGYIL